MKIRYKLLVPLLGALLASFIVFFLVIGIDQNAKKSKALEEKIETMTELVATANVVYVWNFDMVGLRQSLASFLKDREIVAIDIMDMKGNSILSVEDPEKPAVLTVAEKEIVMEGNPIGMSRVTFTDSYTKKEVADIVAQLSVLAGIVFIIIAALIILLARAVTDPIVRLGGVVKDIAEGEGDLTVKTGLTGRDEIGRLSGDFDQFIGKLRGIVVSVKGVGSESRSLGAQLAANTEEVSASSVEIASNMNSMKDRTDYLNSEVQKSAQAVDRINSHIDKVVLMIQDQAASVNESSAATTQMIANVANIEQSTDSKLAITMDLEALAKRSDESMAKNVNAMDDISRSTETISGMIGVINDVASKTNLLAMNAAIEAAHAGDFGRGFSVVADEIRKLAEQTSENAKNISGSLSEIVVKISAASKLTQDSSALISSVIKGIVDVSGGMKETLAGLKEISIGNRQITESLATLNKLTEDVKSSGGEMREGTELVQGSFKQISALTTENARGFQEMAIGMNEINGAIGLLRELSNKNAETMSRLDSEMRKFKT